MTRYQRRRYEYHGPVSGTYWDRPHTEPRLRAVSAIVRELHERAGYPSAGLLATLPGMPSRATTYEILVGRRLPSWPLVWAVGELLARRAGADVADARRRLRAAYAGPPSHRSNAD